MSLKVANFGGGKNSTALLIEAVRRGQRPNLVLFADTGGEKPETYAHVAAFSRWLVERGFPEITVVRTVLPNGATSLEEECAIDGTLPSKAFGQGRCSQKWKIRPQETFLRKRADVQALWATGGRVECWVGFHADELSRIARQKHYDALDPRYYHRHPLAEWDMGEAECLAAIAAAGIAPVPKSACFFCPSTKKHEIRAMQRQHPGLLARALEMERRAKPRLTSIAGLGGYFAWEDYLRQPELPFGAVCDVGGGPDICDSCCDGD